MKEDEKFILSILVLVLGVVLVGCKGKKKQLKFTLEIQQWDKRSILKLSA